MRRLILASGLLLSGCATAPEQTATTAPPATPSQPQRVQSSLVGMTASELVTHLGSPAMQVREGTSVKFQFRGRACVLDAYLYPPPSGAGVLRVTHVDTRSTSGADTAQAACVTSLEQAM